MKSMVEIAPSLQLGENEVKKCLEKMIDNNQIMESEGQYYRI